MSHLFAQNVIKLMLGAVGCIRVVPCLQVHWFVLKDGVCHNKIVGRTQLQQVHVTVSTRPWETKSANSTTTQMRITAPRH